MQLNIKSLIRYTATIIVILAVFSLIYSVLLNIIPSMANVIICILLAGSMIWLYFKWRKTMHLEETFIGIQFIED